MLSPKVSCVQVHFLSNHCKVKWGFGDAFTVYGMLLEGLLEAGNSQSSCLVRVCDGADIPLHQLCLQIRRRRFRSLSAVFRGLPCAMMQVLLCWKGTMTML